jgi:hypothetical protein
MIHTRIGMHNSKVRVKTPRRAVKARKTFTLSPESVALLEELRVSRRRRSVSAVLDDILRALNHHRKEEAIERAISAYYDGLSPEDQKEEMAWADFALTQFTERGD